MVHAGLLPQWEVNEALIYAKEVEAVLQGSDYEIFLAEMYGNTASVWQNDLTGYDRLRAITNSMKRMRVCSPSGALDVDFKGELADVHEGLLPWFDMPNRAAISHAIIFGHWSALGLQQRNQLYALDTVCLWGGKLTAM